MLEKLLPNMAILKSPMNWFLVAFSLALICFLYSFLANKDAE